VNHFLVLIIFQSILHLNAQTAVYPHLFVYDIGPKPSARQYEYGNFTMNTDKITKTNIVIDQELWINAVSENIERLKPNKSGIIIYIHGFQGDNKYFVQSSGYTLQKDVFDNDAHPYGMTISLQWKSGLTYNDAVQTALQKGANMAAIVDTIYQIQQKKYPRAPISVICHSMGNRVWQGLYSEWINLNKALKIDRVLYFAADLECDIFDTAFPELQNHVGHSYVFYSRVDRTLQMANALKVYRRLGIYSTAPQTDLLSKHITLIDATDIKDEETFAGKLSLHRYYYGSPTMRKEIVRLLNGSMVE